ncbi:MAG TPA: hypothetical protein VLL08_31170 [Kineosporiaceae bacterium]|nr:hypothetical protein [Kineosporiaceae bacterium]
MNDTGSAVSTAAATAARTLFGHRGQELAEIGDRLNQLAPSDLQSLLTLISADQAAKVRAHSVAAGTHFHRASTVDPRLLHRVEGLIMAAEPGLEFVELSPLQPFGINHALAGVSQKNVVSALRGSEVNADATTALFSEAVRRLKSGAAHPVRLAAHCRSTRSQRFPENSPLLPHFKVWAQVSIGPHGNPYGHQELVALLAHLTSELRVLESVIASTGRTDVTLKVSISNVLLSRQLAAAGVIEVPNHPAEGEADPLLAQVPAETSFDQTGTSEWLQRNGFSSGAKITEKFREIVRELAPQLAPRLVFDLHRPYGVGYYKHLCYKIAAFTPDAGRIPLVDGGSTSWADKTLGHRRTYCITSGMGTELLCRHLLANR